MTQNNYHCTQQQLYTIARAAWQNCSSRIADFAALRAKYTVPFVNGQLTAVDAAEALPDEEQRKQDSQLKREQLRVLAADSRDAWQKLKLYIEEAFPKNEVPIQLSAAGQSHYAAAQKDNWDAVQRLLIDGFDFITANTAALEANGNMPATFSNDFEDFKDDFNDLYQQTVNATLNDEVETQTKLNANNTVYEDLISMCKDGQRIYKDDEAVSNLFTFEQLLLDIAGPGNQGYKGNITQTNGADVTGGTVEFSGPTNKTVAIDENGHYDCPQLAAGPGYTITITVPACEVKVIENKEVETGVMKTLNIQVTSNPS